MKFASHTWLGIALADKACLFFKRMKNIKIADKDDILQKNVKMSLRK